jgi:hypothetical protein
MMTTQLSRETVTLESLGPVDISYIYVPIDDFARRATLRPSPGYYEVAVLWGEDDNGDQRHCYIVDSNLVNREQSDQLAEWLSDPTHLAQFMYHMLTHVRRYEWE